MVSGRGYCRGPFKRGLDIVAGVLGLLVLSPVIAACALLIGLTSGLPILFRQQRVGMDGRLFEIWKFRTMTPQAAGLPITGARDPRITPAGRWLRASKLDELPQLFNVVAGQMSIVGPRPELPRYVARYTEAQRLVLEVRPGLTDLASVRFRDEEALLGGVAEGDRERYYVTRVVPKKLALNMDYIEHASPFYDLRLVFETLVAIIVPGRH